MRAKRSINLTIELLALAVQVRQIKNENKFAPRDLTQLMARSI